MTRCSGRLYLVLGKISMETETHSFDESIYTLDA